MRIDRTHVAWAVWTAALLALAAAAYWFLVRHSPGIPGGSVPGLIFGIAGYGCMVYAALLSLRKKFTAWRIGRAKTWMRGHLWLGLLSYPLVLLHGGFSFGSGLTFWLMLIFSIVIVTGLLGAALQHYIPNLMTEMVTSETIYYEHDHIQQQLAQEADALVAPLFKKENQYGLLVPAAEKTVVRAASITTTLVRLSEDSGKKLQEAYQNTIQPYLARCRAYDHDLNDRQVAEVLFAELRTVLPDEAGPVVDDLEDICKDKRDLDRQSRLHRLLYSWLLVHVPLSYLLIILGAIHAVMALRYR